ncbi:DNA phosphorothioation-dependent restriction protein DptG [Niallia endozanthoxylica]|uniref:DNA phosphorothioation-dependent restriction protein DptG n=1 Tax=Niallia endozanthoxylica TaxID=2036016 RepID=A0A5J5HNJ6_9BACI|nr:DNA phosphorothioation-dependent restriction protein DptG [Niallia endozanthoxylica]KAA9022943.1 DNA phosphorothioation-dependent restriction protein DptG [Niallia endozanthoxylica]
MMLSALEEIRNTLVSTKNGKTTLKHTINKRTAFLPFQTRNPERAKFKNGFTPVLGQFFRYVEKAGSDFELNGESIIQEISHSVEMDENDRPYFERILESYLFEASSIRIFHPSMYKYLPLSESKESHGEGEIAQFLYDALLESDSGKLEDILELKEKEHVLARLIQQHMPRLEAKERKVKYTPTLAFIRETFAEDLQTLLSNREFFMNHINLFLAYYYFYSASQFTLKINQFEKMDTFSPTPIYYNLDWEASNRNRMAVKTGFKVVMDNARRLLGHVNTVEHLNYLMNTENLVYIELQERFKAISEDEQTSLLDDLYTWTREYSEITLGNQHEIEKKQDFMEGCKQLHVQISKGLSLETKYRYALAINEIGKTYFLKTRGSLGNILNVTQDFLILLTALSVKHEKISLKQLFIEFEKRGVFFDRYSKEAIVELFNKLNLIEKKSDSGDAQYVKPIL